MLDKINSYRRKVTKKLTKNIGKTNYKSFETIDPQKIKKILVIRPNHRLGNQLLVTPLVQELKERFPNSTVDLFLKGNLGPILFENFENVNQVIPLPKKHFKELFQYVKGWTRLMTHSYDLAVNVNRSSSSGKLATKLSNAKYKIFGENEETLQTQLKDYQHAAKNPVYNLRKVLHYASFENIPVLDLKLDETEKNNGKKMLNDIIKNNLKTIALFTYATGKKCYSKEWWQTFYDNLKQVFPKYNIIEVLPVENVSQLDFTIPSFYSKNIREIAGLIANCDVFIGADSGIMHLASASLTPTIGLFQYQNLPVYQPYGNQNTGFNTRQTPNSEIIHYIDKLLHTRI